MRGRFAIPLHDSADTLVAYCGRAVKDESPALIFPNGFQPESLIFAAERVQPGPICLVRDPLQVLTAHESGIENVVAFLTEAISAQQLEMLAASDGSKKLRASNCTDPTPRSGRLTSGRFFVLYGTREMS
jgi:hypothetical protein